MTRCMQPLQGEDDASTLEMVAAYSQQMIFGSKVERRSGSGELPTSLVEVRSAHDAASADGLNGYRGVGH